MNKKLLGAALVTGAAVVAVATTWSKWGSLVKASIQDVLIWALDEGEEDEEEEEEERQDVLAAFEAGEKGRTQEPKGPRDWGYETGEGEIN